MQNKKLEKFFVKAGYGAVISFLLGLMYKQGEKINEAVDTKYEKEHDVPKNSTLFRR